MQKDKRQPELADIFRRYGENYRQSHYLSTEQLKTMHRTEVIKNAANGFSEFANELSVGVVILLFNWVIMQKLGENGLAAFTIINYSIFFALMVCYAISESTQPIISKNYGALNGKRIYSFLKTASCTVIIIGISMSIIMFFFSPA